MARSKNLVLLLIVLFSCQGGKTNEEYLQVPFLHEHKGTANYEVIEIADWGEVKWDSIGNVFLVTASKSYDKFSRTGVLLDSIENNYSLRVDGFIFNDNDYNMWIYNNDKTKYLTIDLDVLDSIVYMNKHVEFYNKSSIVYYGNTFYYCYFFDGKWYRLKKRGSIDEHIYPEKLPPPRLQKIETKQNPPEFVRQRYFPSKKVKANSVLGSPSDFTLGSYIISIGLPGGDTLTYRRLGDGLGNLSQFYQLPASKGGTDSVLFISQLYNNQKGTDGGVYFSHGGLFMIRPKQEKVN